MDVSEVWQFFNHHGTGTMARLWLESQHSTADRRYRPARDEHMSEIDGDKWIGYQPGKKGSAFNLALPQFFAELALHPDRSFSRQKSEIQYP
jgi:hypothetical protein